ncbi:MAG: hypothetical protein F7C35_07030 [Desulfurococcales archaeon]|nr:hypothetical protein [Desulfurococcales archaeon]
MKPEARVLLSSCGQVFGQELCLALILRGSGVDGAVSGRGCRDLCKNAEEKGYSGELRYALGDCSCGLPTPPASRPEWERALAAIKESWEWFTYYKDP